MHDNKTYLARTHFGRMETLKTFTNNENLTFFVPKRPSFLNILGNY